jgi:putative PIN family toxin of toxin-antitoxin system
MKVVLDANIYVSSMINTQGNPRRIIKRWEQGDFDVLVSTSIINEIGRVLRYPRIAKRHKQDEKEIKRFLELLSSEAILIEPSNRLDIIQEDESDNRYLECAIEGKAQYIISGDNHLLKVGEFKGIIVLPPNAFVALLTGGNL